MKTITTLPNTHVIINRLQPADAPDGELSVELLSTTPGFTRQSLSLPRMLARNDQRRPHVSCQGLGDMLDESTVPPKFISDSSQRRLGISQHWGTLLLPRLIAQPLFDDR